MSRKVVKLTVVAAVAVYGATFCQIQRAQAQDGLQIAAGILNGIAQGLSGNSAQPSIPPSMGSSHGTHHVYIHPDRLRPGANIAVPGTSQTHYTYTPGVGWVRRHNYLGADGRWHGSDHFANPNGGTTTLHRAPPRTTRSAGSSHNVARPATRYRSW